MFFGGFEVVKAAFMSFLLVSTLFWHCFFKMQAVFLIYMLFFLVVGACVHCKNERGASTGCDFLYFLENSFGTSSRRTRRLL